MLLASLHKWLLAMLMVLSAPDSAVTPATDTCWILPEAEGLSASISAEHSLHDACSAALRELRLTQRVLQAVDGEESQHIYDYRQSLNEMCDKYDGLRTHAEVVAVAQSLATDLRLAFRALEDATTDPRLWRQLRLAADPDATVIRFPSRLVRKTGKLPSVEPWTSADFETWV